MLPLDETLQRLLALPREAGTPPVAEARTIVTDHLTALGYRVTRQSFRFSPSALSAFPLFGAALGWLTLLLIPLLLMEHVADWLPLTLWSSGLAAATILAVTTGLGWTAISRDHTPRDDANLIATRADVPIRRWIVAHLDSKAQGHSMAGRLVAVWLVLVAIVVITTLTILRLEGTISPIAACAGATVALFAGTLAGRGRLQGTSRGARDNGTGVAAALAAAEAITDPSVGILITGAEEFGLIGARIFARHSTHAIERTEIINLDTIDDEGVLAIVSHDERGARLARRLAPILATVGPPIRLRKLPLGIFVDSLPLARAGAQAVTIGRLTWHTLRQIHTPNDVPETLSLDTAIHIGQVIARLPMPVADGNEGAFP